MSTAGSRPRAHRGTRHEKLTLPGKYPVFATRTISRALLCKCPAQRVAMTGCTCASLSIFKTAILPSGENWGAACVQRSTSALTSCRAASSLGCLSTSDGCSALARAVQAEITSYAAVRRGALTWDTTSFNNFLVYCFNVGCMSGNGGSHFNVLPRSPCVPTTHSHAQRSCTFSCSGWHMR